MARFRTYEFGPFRLVPHEGLLTRDGSPVAIVPKAFSTLVLLAENHGSLVTKAEILEKVWDDAFVEEAAISRCIWAIRTALGEDAKSQTFIQTVPKRGYRFVGEVFERNGTAAHKRPLDLVDSPSAPSSNVTQIGRINRAQLNFAINERPDNTVQFPVPSQNDKLRAVPQARPGRNFKLPILAGLVFLVLAAAYVGKIMFVEPASLSLVDRPKVAILPLRPVSADVRDPIAEFAIAESLIIKISESPDLIVRPLGAVRKYIELDRDPVQAGKELNADYVLSSNYQLSDGRIRVTSQLFNSRTGVAEATFKSESAAADKFAMQDAIANDIGNAIFGRFGSSRTTYESKRGTLNEEAYRLYLQGHYLVEKKTQRDAKRAIEVFDLALKLDPTYAQAWAGKANAHCTFAHTGGIEPNVAFEIARPALDRAFELNPNLPEAHAVRGIITFDYDWEFEKGLESFRRSIAIDPNYEMAGRAYATRLALAGHHEKALAQIKTAIDIFPNSIMHQMDYASVLYQSRRFDDAIIQLNRVLELAPNMQLASNLMWICYHLNGDHDQAYKWFLKNQEMKGSQSNVIEAYRGAFDRYGWNGVLKKFSEISRADYSPGQYNKTAYQNLIASALVGDRDAAVSFLSDGLNNKDLWVPYAMHDPAYEGLRQDPRFREMFRKIEPTPPL